MAEDQTITCGDCGAAFIHSVKDQEFFASMNFSPPRRCRDCRQRRKAEKEGGGSSGGGAGGSGHSGGSGGSGHSGGFSTAPYTPVAQVQTAPRPGPGWSPPVEVQHRRPARPSKGRKREHDFGTDD